MPTLNVNGESVTVDDSFLKLSPEQQHATVDEIAKSLPPSFDSPEFDKAIAKKYDISPEMVARLKQSESGAAGLRGIPIAGGFVDTLGARISAAMNPLTGAGAPGTTYAERVERNRSLESDLTRAYERAHPIESGAAGLIGGTAALGGLGTTGAGASLLGLGARTLPGQVGGGIASGGTIGALDALARGNSPVAEGGTGAALGAAFPIAGRSVSAMLSPIISNIHARINPEGFAQTQVARALMESGQTPQDITNALRQAAMEGQGSFTAADVMGNAGQRMLSTVARAPGEGRQAVVDFLENRQAAQGRRVASQLAEGFEAPRTAADLEQAMRAARDAHADVEYAAARANAGPVNVLPVIANIDATLAPGATQVARPQSGLASDSIERALESIRARLTDGRSMLSDFTALQRVRGDVADMVQQATQRGQGNRARLLGGVLRSLDGAMEQASPGFRQANQTFAQLTRNMEAIGQGQTAAMRGRTEDIIPRFQGLTPEGQVGFRTGYVDPLIAQTQGAAMGVNKARPFTSDAFAAEARAMAPQADLMARQLARENTMFQTRHQAIGGSATAQNLADQAAMGIDPTLIGHLLGGNMMGALRHSVLSAGNALSGNTAAVRREVANLLLSRGGNLPPAAFQRLLDDAVRRIETIRRGTQGLSRAAAGALAVQLNR